MRRPFQGYDGATGIALDDCSGRWERTLFDNFFVSLEGFWEFMSSNFGIGSCSGCTFSMGGSDDMLAWATGMCVGPAIMQLHCFVLGVVVSLGFCTLIHLHYILRLNCAH